MTFTDHSQDVVRHFLRTALIVDDRIGKEAEDEEAVGTLTLPGHPGGSAPTSETKSESDPEPEPPGTAEEHPSTVPKPEARKDKAHGINTQAVIRGFAKDNVFCSTVGVDEGDNVDTLVARALPLAQQADVFVTDWVLFPGGDREGGAALELISRTISEATAPDRFRLIVVWTGTQDLRDIAKSICERLREEGMNADRPEDGYVVSCGPARIAVYAKPESGIDDTAPELFERVIQPQDLTDRVVAEFAAETSGLLSNAALRALAAVRDNTQRLLRTFRPEMDPALMAHRAMLPNPADAEDQAQELISDELRAIVTGARVGEEVSLERITGRMADDEPELTPLFQRTAEREALDASATRAIARRLLEVGTDLVEHDSIFEPLGSGNHRKKISNRPEHYSLTSALDRRGALDAESASRLRDEFAALTSNKTRYGDAVPMLTAGVIVRFSGIGAVALPEFGLCVQPFCDSVRLDSVGPRVSFPFVPLDPAGAGKLSFLVRDPDDAASHLPLKATFRPRDLVQVVFKVPTGHDRVVFDRSSDRLCVRAPDGTDCEFVSELKAAHTYRALSHFYQQAGRPGLDESEWLRRMST